MKWTINQKTLDLKFEKVCTNKVVDEVFPDLVQAEL